MLSLNFEWLGSTLYTNSLITQNDRIQRVVSDNEIYILGQEHSPIITVGRKSDVSLYSEEHVTFEEDQVYDQRDAEGFIKLNALRLRLAAKMRGDS